MLYQLLSKYYILWGVIDSHILPVAMATSCTSVVILMSNIYIGKYRIKVMCTPLQHVSTSAVTLYVGTVQVVSLGKRSCYARLTGYFVSYTYIHCMI